MNTLQSGVLKAALVLSPVLITVEELARTTVESNYVENESDEIADAASQLQAVSDHLTLWHTAGLISIAYAAAWCLALLAIVVVIGRSRPVIGTVTGILGLCSVLGIAMHAIFYYAIAGGLAQESDRALATQAATIGGDDLITIVGLIFFLLGTLLVTISMAFGLWRARALPWWGAVGFLVWFGYVFSGPEARVAALLNLALLLPFIAVARQLQPGRAVLEQPQPATT
ncbi:MAG TPA: hypothetical protein VKB55_00535 [Nocardioidaceae bacterium]|nr:hypothetical protein [Nocardioidaceae bacterium]